MNRLDDLMETMPYKVNAANDYPPIEIVVVNYNSSDGIYDYMNDLIQNTYLEGGSFITYLTYTGRKFYHAAHANNLAMLSGSGEYVVLTPADNVIYDNYIPSLRSLISDGCIWITPPRKCRSMIAVRKDEFIDAGGYDERFEMYGPDDRDLIERLERRGKKFGAVPHRSVTTIYTEPEKKIENYRLKISHQELGRMTMPYYYENKEKGVLVANVGVEWGKWDE